MKVITTFILICSAAGLGYAAEVDYQPSELSIIAEHEPLDSVLRSVSRAMHITLVAPSGLNDPISCYIRNMPVQRAFRNLLGGMNYALEWEDGGKRLSGLIIIVEGKPSAVVIRPDVLVAEPLFAGANIEKKLSGNEIDMDDDKQVELDAGHQDQVETISEKTEVEDDPEIENNQIDADEEKLDH